MRRLLVVGVVAAASLVVTPIAAADFIQWRYEVALAAQTRDAGASYPELRASEASAESYSRKIDAGAHYPGSWDQYANYVDAWGYACHSFAGTTTLGGLIFNPHTVSQYPVPASIRTPSWELACA
ncbi:MAG TPA: hypothetical protein VFT50_15525 [Baekduia sp.]|nr:hypothetical protein [Baekduia sp.]